jgi:3',5'-cyclic AMP phosphodiesterase CpdA
VTESGTPRHRYWIVALALVVVAVLAVTALQPEARTWVRFQLSDHIGAPPAGEPFEPFDPISAPAQRFAVAGDVGTGDDVEQRTAHAMDLVEGDVDYDALLLLGDNVYPNGDPAEVSRTVFEPFNAVLDEGTELVAVLGNHDVRDGNGDEQAAALGMPARWYSRRIGDVLVIALDSTQPDNPDQIAWLQSTLEQQEAPWTIALLHHPPYSGGYHGSDFPSREQFAPLFTRYGVDLVLSGHDHDYQRTVPIDGVTYVVTGAAAKRRPTDRTDVTAAAWSTNSFVDLAVYDDHIDLRAIDQSGRVFDHARIP